MKVIKVFIFIMLFLTFSLNALADSDGTFCLTDEYVAVEARGINIPVIEDSWIVAHYSSAGIGEIEVIPASDTRSQSIDCSTSNDNIIKKGDLAYIKKPDFIRLLTIENGDTIDLVFSIARDNKVVNGSGPLLHYFSLTIVQSASYHQIKEAKLVASGMRFESIH